MSLLARAAGFTPFGPIFGKELRVTSRRKRSYLLRVGYLGLLLMALLLAYASTGRSRGGVAAQAMQQQELGFAFFMAFTLFCVGSMGLIGPVLTANAIGAEKLAKTLPVLLMTPITAWQIVSGKLFSRVLAALTLLGLSLPVLALVRLLGGVELEQMVAVLALAVSFVIACAALGLFYSLFITRPAVVILLSYVTLGVLYWLLPAVLIVLFDFLDGGPRGGMFGAQFLAAIHPFGCAVAQAVPQLRTVVGDAWIASVLVQLAFAGLLMMVTAVLLRRRFRDGGEGGGGGVSLTPAPVPPDGVIPALRVAGGMLTGAAAVSDGTLPVPGTHAGGVGVTGPPDASDGAGRPPALGYATAGMKARDAKVRDVSDNPVLWREVRRPMLARVWQRVVAVCVVLGILGLVYLMMAVERALDETDAQIGFAFVMHGLWWLVVSVLSATAIAQEKETDTWTLLLTTPMTGRQIVWGKAAGLLRRMLWPTLLIVGHFLLFTVGGVVPPWAFLFVLWMLLSCNSTWIATGVYLSLRLKKVTFAVIANLLLAVAVYGLVPLVLFVPAELLGRSGERVAEQTLWLLPYYYLGEGFDGMDGLMDRSQTYYSSGYGYGGYGSSYEYAFRLPGGGMPASTGMFLGFAVACGLLHLLAAYLVLHRTAANFDEIVGRAGRRRFLSLTDTDGSVLPPAAAGEGVAAGRGGTTTVAPGLTGGTPARAGAGQAAAAAASIPTAAEDPDTYASVPSRLVAWLTDIVIVQFACGVAALTWGVVAIVSDAADDLPESAVTRMLLDYLATGIWASFVVGWLYTAGFESSRRRATPGRMLAGILVTDADGRRLSFARASARYWARHLALLPLAAGFVVALFTPRRQALHDLMAGTLVLRK